MKRGRPAVRITVTSTIMNILERSETPLTTSALRKFLSQELNQEFSWNTVQKYVGELLQSNRLTSIQLPHTKEPTKTGLTVYTLKR